VLQQVRRVLKDFTVYGIGSILPKAVAFLLIPVYTRFLTPEDYGILSLATMIATMATVALTLGQNGSLTLYFRSSQAEEDGEAGIRSMLFSVVVAVLAFGAAATALLMWAGPKVTPSLLSSERITFDPYLQTALWIAYLGVPLALLQAVNRARGQAKTHTTFQLASFAVNVSATLYFIAALRQGAIGSLRGTLTATLVLLPVALALLVREMEFKFSWHWLKRSLVFGLPLVPHYFAGWLLTFADRYMLERLSTIEAVGLYSLAYNVSMALSLVTSSLNQAWGPIYYDMAGDEDQRGLLPRLSTIYAAGVTIAAIAFLALSRELLVILAAERYWEAAGVVPIVTAGYYAFAMYSVLSTGTFFAKRTGRIMLLTSFAAAANIGANLLLIPRYGMYGAAWATLISYTLMAIGARVLTGWSMPGSLEDGKLLRATIVFAVAFVGNHAIDGFALPLAADILAKLALVAASAGLLMVGGVVSAHEVRRFIARMGRRNGSA